ncbi:response regulator [Cohnella sp. AR92]|uniref:response regulator n=1 Tax=Cohnella sp. AR92 TaxID=648716 RepID=UPI000F8D1532|nr:response regulator [Cohnella sp. AR92]RUS45128.1 response regulator [Cohnella sp. AR92]
MRKALLVDDEPFAIEALQLFVDWEGYGFQICGVCENGEEALAAIEREKPDVVFTDIRMPVMDGLQLIESVSASPDGKLVQFVILSGYGEFEYAQSALRLGVRHYLLKPIMPEEADSVMQDVVRRMEATESKEAPISFPREAEAALLEAIERGDEPRVRLEVDRLSSEMKELGADSATVGALLDHLAYRCMLVLQEMGADPEPLHRRWSQRYSGAGQAGLNQRWELFLRFADEAMRAMGDVRKARSFHPVDEAERYIRANFRQPITVGELAERFYMNAAYLGQAFQAKVGKGVIEYVHDLRIEEARRLMSEAPERRLSEIAETVGYSHYHHFLKQYEKRHHAKPTGGAFQ